MQIKGQPAVVWFNNSLTKGQFLLMRRHSRLQSTEPLWLGVTSGQFRKGKIDPLQTIDSLATFESLPDITNCRQ